MMTNDRIAPASNMTAGERPPDEGSVWLRARGRPRVDAHPVLGGEIDDACARMVRFAPVLAALFPDDGWSGAVRSPLLAYPTGLTPVDGLLVKADHALPVTGSVKARGGLHDLLRAVERIALARGLVTANGDRRALLSPGARGRLAEERVVVASTGNLGFSIGLVGKALGLAVEVHMSHDAKGWKKDRLRDLGAIVIEHPCDYASTLALAREAARATGGYFVDDENSRDLLLGYATGGFELAEQLEDRGRAPSSMAPVVVYLPCGVGGAPGGITAGLRHRFGEALTTVFVEPTRSACVLAALTCGNGRPLSVFDAGMDNRTVADGLATPLASGLVLDAVREQIDAVVTVGDGAMLDWVARAWRDAGLRLEPSAAAAFASIASFRAAIPLDHPALRPDALHVAWTTGGDHLPDMEFARLLGAATDIVSDSDGNRLLRP